ncbi:MAG: S9 family peptidase [Planctomycetota bacterium]
MSFRNVFAHAVAVGLLAGLSVPMFVVSVPLFAAEGTIAADDSKNSQPKTASRSVTGAARKSTSLSAPLATRKPKTLSDHGVQRQDPYYWLRERENPDVIAYLDAENDYTDAMLQDLGTLEETLFEEMKSRIKEDDASVPYEDNGYVYYTRFEEGQQYPIYCRKKIGEDREQVTLDVNELCRDQPYCSVVGVSVSPDSQRLVFGIDTTGRRKYTLRFKDLKSGKWLDSSITDVAGSAVWAADSKTVFFTRRDPQTLRAYRVLRYRVGDPVDQATLVFEETDEEFSCGVGRTRSKAFIVIRSNQTLSTESRFLAADDPTGDFQVFLPRRPDHEYSINHIGDHFYVTSNQDAPNFRLLRTPQAKIAETHWEEVIPHRDDVLLQGVTLFDEFLVASERSEAQTRLRVMSRQATSGDGKPLDYFVPVEEDAYVIRSAATPDPNTSRLRYSYTSLTTPSSVYEFDMESRQTKLLKRQPVLGDFDPERYTTRRLWATARDGVRVPVTVVHRKDTPIDGTAPCLQYGYGSYGSSMDPRFSSTTLSLLDRGFVYAIAHIRGGQEMGRKWYDDGKLLRKRNTFNDFIDVGKFLVAQKFAAKDKLFCRGGSAGGLLIGAVINMAPGQYAGAIADVPFVDVVTTMLDETIPLTTFEYDEWGNPNEKEYFDYMLSYSPYDQVTAQDYPPLLVTTGLHDSQVQYWEPAKWVAKLRVTKTDTNPLLLKTNMDAGHGGASGRFNSLKLVATRYAFLIDLAGAKQQ